MAIKAVENEKLLILGWLLTTDLDTIAPSEHERGAGKPGSEEILRESLRGGESQIKLRRRTVRL